FPNVLIDYVMTETPVPLGWMRSVNALQVAFAAESFMNELAVAAGKDPLEVRVHLLSKGERKRPWGAARCGGRLGIGWEKAGWGKPLTAGHYQGVACYASCNSYSTAVVEISMEGDQPRVHRVVSAIDCGLVVNPAILEQQIQGGVIFALSNALRAQITIEK